jgi:hypothetical protein
MILDRLNACIFAHPLVRHAVVLERTAAVCVALRRQRLLLIGLAQFVPLQISKIEPICVAAWAAATIAP